MTLISSSIAENSFNSYKLTKSKGNCVYISYRLCIYFYYVFQLQYPAPIASRSRERKPRTHRIDNVDKHATAIGVVRCFMWQ
jgi:hypothetical protein